MLYKFLELITKRRKIIFVSSASVAIGALILLFSAKPFYKTTLQISFGEVWPGQVKNKALLSAYMKRQCELIKSKDILDKVIDKLHLGMDKRFMARDTSFVLKKLIKIKRIKGTNLVDINVYMNDPNVASRVALALAEEYIQSVQNAKFSISEEATKWLDESEDVSLKIKESERKLKEFIETNSLELLDERLDMLKTSQEILITQKDEIEMNLTKTKSELGIIEEMLEKGDKEGVFSVLNKDNVISVLNGQKEENQKRINELKRVYEPMHPDIVQLTKEITAIDKEIDSRVQEAVKRSNMEIGSMEARLLTLEKEISANKESLSRLESSKIELDALERELERNKLLYDETLNMLKEGEIPLINIKGPSIPNESTLTVPIGYNKIWKVTLGVISGFLFGVIISFALEIREKRP